MKQGFKGTTEQLNVNSKDMPSVESAVTAKLQQDPSIDHIIALDASIALTTVQAKKTVRSEAVVDTFDTNAELVSAIKNGNIGWAIDQQPSCRATWRSSPSGCSSTTATPLAAEHPQQAPAFIDSGRHRVDRGVCRQWHPLVVGAQRRWRVGVVVTHERIDPVADLDLTACRRLGSGSTHILIPSDSVC